MSETRTCRICGRTLPITEFYRDGDGRKHRCKACDLAKRKQNRKPYRDRIRLPALTPPEDCPIENPVAFLLAGVLGQALHDLQAFGVPEYPGHMDAEEGYSEIPAGCDFDARDALAWLGEYGEDWCELIDKPREWAAEAILTRLGQGCAA